MPVTLRPFLIGLALTVFLPGTIQARFTLVDDLNSIPWYCLAFLLAQPLTFHQDYALTSNLEWHPESWLKINFRVLDESPSFDKLESSGSGAMQYLPISAGIDAPLESPGLVALESAEISEKSPDEPEVLTLVVYPDQPGQFSIELPVYNNSGTDEQDANSIQTTAPDLIRLLKVALLFIQQQLLPSFRKTMY